MYFINRKPRLARDVLHWFPALQLSLCFSCALCIAWPQCQKTIRTQNHSNGSGGFLDKRCCFVTAMGFYYLHNAYCRPGVYTIFAFLEYIIVLSNIAYHVCVSLDFSDREIRFGVIQSKNSLN
ncbi:putative post-GPI attachment to proteins factor 2 [Apostichopus japonicus]|uniref:Putative post-GPI attachment to proteins factor 2 n=1 Tax=Stichopus japonicus TaxID=307972 RepID=A0A2G8JG84_STIJA|nr:putative post-GPI attachment to proteins factor 2 [Apostichopus japonicus]